MYLQGYLVQAISGVLAGVPDTGYIWCTCMGTWCRLYLVYLQGYLVQAISGVFAGLPDTGYIWCTSMGTW